MSAALVNLMEDVMGQAEGIVDAEEVGEAQEESESAGQEESESALASGKTKLAMKGLSSIKKGLITKMVMKPLMAMVKSPWYLVRGFCRLVAKPFAKLKAKKAQKDQKAQKAQKKKK